MHTSPQPRWALTLFLRDSDTCGVVRLEVLPNVAEILDLATVCFQVPYYGTANPHLLTDWHCCFSPGFYAPNEESTVLWGSMILLCSGKTALTLIMNS